jgi:hypothetical protein
MPDAAGMLGKNHVLIIKPVRIKLGDHMTLTVAGIVRIDQRAMLRQKLLNPFTSPRKSLAKRCRRNLKYGCPLLTIHIKYIRQEISQSVIPIQTKQQPLQATDSVSSTKRCCSVSIAIPANPQLILNQDSLRILQRIPPEFCTALAHGQQVIAATCTSRC